MKFIVVLMTLAALAAPALADDSGWKPSASIDVLASGNASKHNRSTRDALCASLIVQGLPCSGAASSYTAVGGRVGVFDSQGNTRYGASFGVLNGGPNRGKVTVNTTPAGSLTLNNKSTTFRLLAEAGQKFPINEDWAVSAGAGLGWGATNETLGCSASGSLGTSCAGTGGTTNLGWATWELTPALLWRGVEVGARYVGMARGRQNPWHTYGGTVGYRF